MIDVTDENQTPNPVTPASPAAPAPTGVVDPITSQPAPMPSFGQSNTSGQGSAAVVPEEVKGWSWGGFFLSWIWAIGNSVWIGLLALVPYVGFVMAIVLGAKGREWAWQAKHWDSIEQFKQVQRTWSIAGFILAGIGVLAVILILVVIVVVAINPAARMSSTPSY